MRSDLYFMAEQLGLYWEQQSEQMEIACNLLSQRRFAASKGKGISLENGCTSFGLPGVP